MKRPGISLYSKICFISYVLELVVLLPVFYIFRDTILSHMTLALPVVAGWALSTIPDIKAHIEVAHAQRIFRR